MATIDELADRLQAFFAEKFPPGTGDGPGNVRLLFDGLGLPLSAEDFIGAGTDAARDLLAHQKAAALADQLPAANLLSQGWYLARSGSRLSKWYEQVVEGATPASDDVAALNQITLLKADARTSLMQNDLIVLSGTAVGGSGGTEAAVGTHDRYYATTMSPSDWYEASSTSWQHYDMRSSQASSPPSQGGGEGPAPGPIGRPRFALRVVEDASDPELTTFLTKAVVASGEATQAAPAEPEGSIGATPAVRASPVLRFRADRHLLTRNLALADAVDGSSSRTMLTREAQIAEPAILTLAKSGILVGDTHPDRVRDRFEVASKLGDIAALQLDPGVVHEATKPVAPTSNDFEVSFDYCMVRFERPWWSEIFLLSRLWSLPGFAPGAIASGSGTHLDAPLTMMTIGMIAVKNLKISANWSDTDKSALTGATSLGPFCIAGAAYDASSGTIAREGMQAIAWLCQVPPVLPPTPL